MFFTRTFVAAIFAAASVFALATADRDFLLQAAEGGRMEVELARGAAQKAASLEVKQFAQQLLDDHAKTNQEIKQLAEKKGVIVDASSSRATPHLQERLSKLSGDQFDRVYIQEMMAEHQKDAAAFENAAKTAKDADIRAFAAKTLQTIRQHLEKVGALHRKLSAPGTSGNPV